jgi:UDP-N-acetylmuramoyl-tripeptide--D-alanyl-D-alanine ligase
MDAYNANPSSMSAAIHEFLRLEGQNKLLILGEMREVGDASQAEHKEIVALLRKHDVSNAICVGKSFEPYAKEAGYKQTESIDSLCELLLTEPIKGYFVFVKGSRSNRLEKIIPLL